MLEVQKFLQSNKLEDLTSQLGIKVKRHGRYPNLVLLDYSQIDSPKLHPIVRECRGLILDESSGWRIVAMPYKRFFNYGENGADEIDWKTAVVQEKLDGSLCTLYWYENEWHVASRGFPDACGKVGENDFTFAELFWRVWDEMGYELPGSLKGCYMFELMTPYNKVIVQHQKNRLVLHGVNYIGYGGRVIPQNPIAVADLFGWEVVKTYPLQSWDGILKACEALNPVESEGFVVVDANYNRVKVKSPQYVALSHIKEGLSVRRLIEICLANESEEFLTYFPEWKELYNEVKTKLHDLMAMANAVYSKVKDIESQKEFALAIKDFSFSGVLFALRAGKVTSIRDGFKEVSVKRLEEVLDIRL